MDYQAVTSAILRFIDNKPLDHGGYTDLLSAVRQWEEEDFQAAHAVNGQLRELAAKTLRVCYEHHRRFQEQGEQHLHECPLFDHHLGFQREKLVY